ncbi:MAG: hypothetical protein U5L73_03300 [Rhodoferax sp.]|uniref:hypothetical protein n=1 Tax=Rhodoferax sp. TaxID=50421 RepID=UPI002ACE59D7|nr:hypothetical protein [Rhodoferax sp.]MDZ7890768.1 hypothetical protein [Rhodoferax sp.]
MILKNSNAPEAYTPKSFIVILLLAPKGSSSKRRKPLRQIVNTKLIASGLSGIPHTGA